MAQEDSSAPLQAVLFDIDGTLCDSYELAFAASNVVLAAHGSGPISPAEYHDGTKYCTPERLARHHGLAPEDADGGLAFRHMGAILGAEFDARYIALVSPDTAPVFSGIPSLVRDLAAACVPVAALTNACLSYAERVLDTHALVRCSCFFRACVVV